MSISIQEPKFLSCPIGKNAEEGTINEIPQKRDADVDAWRATISDGFPLLTMLPKDRGGEPPEGQDFNGINYLLSSHIDFQQQGGLYTFNQEWSDANMGYAKNSVLWYVPEEGKPFQVKSLIPNNTYNFIENPDYLDNIHWSTLSSTSTGYIFMWGGDTAPDGAFLCNGAEKSKLEYAPLYSVIGDKHGVVTDNNTYYCYKTLENVKYYITQNSFTSGLTLYNRANHNAIIGETFTSKTTPVAELTDNQGCYFDIEATGNTFNFFSYTLRNISYYTQAEMLEIEGIDYDLYNSDQTEVVGISCYKVVEDEAGFYATFDDGETWVKLTRNSDDDYSYVQYHTVDSVLYYTKSSLTSQGTTLLSDKNKLEGNDVGLAYSQINGLFCSLETEFNYYSLTRSSADDSEYDNSLFVLPNIEMSGVPITFCIYY